MSRGRSSGDGLGLVLAVRDYRQPVRAGADRVPVYGVAVSEVQLFLGDNVEVMRSMAAESVDLTITSPPYDNLRTYTGYTFDFQSTAAELFRLTKKGGVIVWVVGDQTTNGSETGTSFRQALHFMDLGLNLHDTMIYETDKPPMTGNRYQACFEYMFIFSKGQPKTFNALMIRSAKAGERRGGIRYRQENGELKDQWHGGFYKPTTRRCAIWYYPSGGSEGSKDNAKFLHPATFPDALARDHVLSWSNPGDTVLDPMVGSGTTGVACVQTNRNFIGIDISEEYLALAKRRIEEAQMQDTLL